MKLEFAIKKKKQGERRYEKMLQLATKLQCKNVAEAIAKIGKKPFDEQLNRTSIDE